MAHLKIYRHSGRLGTFGLPLGLLGGLLVALAGAFAYQRFLTWVPYLYVTFLGMLGFGAAIGLTVGIAMRAGKTRNLVLAATIGALCGLIGDIASFQFDYEYRLVELAEAISEEEGRTMSAEELRSDLPLLDFLVLRADIGYTLGRDGGLPIRGILVYLIWLIELVCIVGLAAHFARRRIRDPFCEQCQDWMLNQVVGVAEPIDEGTVKSAVELGDLDALLRPEEGPAFLPKKIVYSIYHCITCDRANYLTLTLHWQEVRAKREAEEKTETLASQVIVTPEQVAILEQHLDAWQARERDGGGGAASAE